VITKRGGMIKLGMDCDKIKAERID